MRSLPHVLVAIVTYESERVVRDCLASLPSAWDGVARCSIVVADNASRDGTVAAVRAACPQATVVRLPSNRGYAAGINAALARGLTEDVAAVMVLNPDIRLTPGSGAAMLRALAEGRTGIVAPRLVDADGALQYSLRREPTVLRALGEALLGGGRAGRVPPLGELVADANVYERPGIADWACGAALLIGRECVDTVGPWDESYFLYSEETDFCLRARDASFRLRYAPDAVGTHLGGESNVSPDLWSLLTRNRIRSYRRRHGAFRGRLFSVAVVLNEALRAARGSATSRAALGTLLGLRRLPFPDGSTDMPSNPPASGSVDGVVCFSAQDWWYFNRGHSDFQLMTRVARDRPVLLVNSLGMRMPTRANTSGPWSRIGRKIRSAARGLTTPVPELPQFHVFTPLFLPVYGEARLARWNRRAVLAQVRFACRRRGIHRPAVVVTLPTAWPIARRLDRSCTIAYRSDRYSALPEADGQLVAALERELLAGADATFFASVALMAEEAPLARRPMLLSHGVDLAQFRPARELTVHPRLADVPRARVGYVGMIDAYTVDLGLLARVADDHPEAQLVLAGPVEVELDELLTRPNVRHVGVLPFDEVPSFLAGLDVALMPWQRNEWIRHCNPIKLKEYLAVELPVVSTDFPEVRRFDHVIAIAQDEDQFSFLVGEALQGRGRGTPTDRHAAVRGETWDVQAERLITVADDVTHIASLPLSARRRATTPLAEPMTPESTCAAS